MYHSFNSSPRLQLVPNKRRKKQGRGGFWHQGPHSKPGPQPALPRGRPHWHDDHGKSSCTCSGSRTNSKTYSRAQDGSWHSIRTQHVLITTKPCFSYPRVGKNLKAGQRGWVIPITSAPGTCKDRERPTDREGPSYGMKNGMGRTRGEECSHQREHNGNREGQF